MSGRLVAVTGASGFVGSYLLSHLRDAALPVVGITRDGVGGTRAVGDLALEPRWHDCLKGVGTVVHCAAVAHKPLGDSDEARSQVNRVNFDAVKRLGEACLASGVKRLLFLSTVKVYGESTSGRSPFAEGDALDPEDDYGASKARAEAALKELIDQGLEVCCLRLPLVYGPGAKANFRRLQTLATTPIPLPLGAIKNRRSVLALSNLAEVVAGMLALDEWPVTELNVADPEPVSVPDLVRMLAYAQGNRAWLFPVPVWLLRSVAGLFGRQAMLERVAGSLEVSTARCADVLPQTHLDSTHLCVQRLYR